MTVIETPRLCLREFEPDDAESLYRLNLDPKVIEFTGDLPFESVKAAGTFLENYRHYRQYGFGRWAVIQKSNGEFLGWCGLKFTPGPDECDIGFRFFRSVWNRGFATESATACIQHGFDSLGLARIVGRAMKENLASVAVLRKTGLKFLKEFDFDGREGVVYFIEKHCD